MISDGTTKAEIPLLISIQFRKTSSHPYPNAHPRQLSHKRTLVVIGSGTGKVKAKAENCEDWILGKVKKSLI